MFLRARERVLVRLVRDKQGESGVTGQDESRTRVVGYVRCGGCGAVGLCNGKRLWMILNAPTLARGDAMPTQNSGSRTLYGGFRTRTHKNYERGVMEQ